MNTTLRRQRERDELRERILAATRTLLARGGTDAVTMREVARLVEYSPAALYQHFPDKEALIRELCLTDFADFAEMFLALPTHGGALAQLFRVGFAYLDFARTHPEHYRFMFMTAHVDAGPDSDEQRQDPGQNAYVSLLTLVEQAIAEGALREDLKDPHLVAQSAWAMTHGIAALDVCRREREAWVDFRPFEVRAASGIRAFVLGIAKDPRQADAAFALVEKERSGD
jgi:AcrR family transcriptional regulator